MAVSIAPRIHASSARSAAVTQSVQRALSLLLLFDRSHPRWRVTDLANASGLPQSTVSRLLSGLERLGFVARDPATGQYELGLTLTTLGSDALSNNAVFREGMGLVSQLANELRLDANLAILREDRLFYLVSLEYPTPRTAVPLSGYEDFLHSTALGAAILSALPDDEVNAIADRLTYVAVTLNTVKTSDELRAKVAEVRQRGYAVDRAENYPGFACIAAPILDGHGRGVAGCSVSGPASVMDLANREQAIADRVREVAALISRNLGFREVGLARNRVVFGSERSTPGF